MVIIACDASSSFIQLTGRSSLYITTPSPGEPTFSLSAELLQDESGDERAGWSEGVDGRAEGAGEERFGGGGCVGRVGRHEESVLEGDVVPSGGVSEVRSEEEDDLKHVEKRDRAKLGTFIKYYGKI